MKSGETQTTEPTRHVQRLRVVLRICTIVLIAGGVFAAFVGIAKHALHLSEAWQQILGPPASYFTDESKALRSQTARVELGDRVFNIPVMYIDSKKSPSRLYKDSILLKVIWPDMGSIYELKDRQEYERLSRTERRIGWMLLEPASKRPTLDWQIANTRPGLTKEEHLGTSGGVEHFLWYRGKPEDPELWAEVYLEKDENGHIVNRIECTRGPIVRFPVCEHKFIDDGVYYDINYNEARFLSEWRELRQRAIDFLRSFETGSTNHQPYRG